MRRILFILCTLVGVFQSAAMSAVNIDIKPEELAISAPHPRLFLDDKEFAAMRSRINSTTDQRVMDMHAQYMAWAEEFVDRQEEFVFERNSSGNILHVCRNAFAQIVSCAYAYRFVKDVKFLEHAEKVLVSVCDFDHWNQSHYLDVANMSMAVSIGYDWLYDKLKNTTRAKCEYALKAFSMGTSEHSSRSQFLSRSWGPPLNSGLLCAAIALYDKIPQRSEMFIRRCIDDVARTIDDHYAPYGVTTGGHTYWEGVASWHMMIITALQQVYGTDFGLSAAPGFKESARFQLFASGNLRQSYNYHDNQIGIRICPSLWYFASLLEDGSVMWLEHQRDYKMRENLGFLYIYHASKVDPKDIRPSKELVFSAKGDNPVVIARTGWEQNDIYLAAKGGRASNRDAHLDAGSFVYEAHGVRWASEPPFPPVAKIDRHISDSGRSARDMGRESWRWKAMGYNNLHHNTLTVNGMDHDCSGLVQLTQINDTPQKRGGVFDMAPVLGKGVSKAERSLNIIDGRYLQIDDEVSADSDMEVYFNFTTKAAVEVTMQGIVLSADGERMLLSAEGADVRYVSGMRRPQDVPSCMEPLYKTKDFSFVGFTYEVKAGQTVCVKTTLKRL